MRCCSGGDGHAPSICPVSPRVKWCTPWASVGIAVQGTAAFHRTRGRPAEGQGGPLSCSGTSSGVPYMQVKQMPELTLDHLRQRRDQILALADRHGARNVRVFGSRAHLIGASVFGKERPHFFGHPGGVLPRVFGRRTMTAIKRTPTGGMSR